MAHGYIDEERECGYCGLTYPVYTDGYAPHDCPAFRTNTEVCAYDGDHIPSRRCDYEPT